MRCLWGEGRCDAGRQREGRADEWQGWSKDSILFPWPDLEWGQSGLWLQKPAASAQVARVVREYSSITEALLGWGADKKTGLTADIWHSLTLLSPFKLPRMRDSSLGEPWSQEVPGSVGTKVIVYRVLWGPEQSARGLIPSPVITLPWRNLTLLGN